MDDTTLTPESAQKGGYPHFMLKEIHEQPEAVKKSVSSRIDKDGLPDFSADGIDADFWRGIRAVQIVACGSAMHAGLVGQRVLEQYAGLPTTVHIASEYRYYPPLGDEGTLVIVISQSGETADSLAALRYAKEHGRHTLGIVNAVETTIAREADKRIYTYAGPEIAVATTKGYCTQASVLYAIAAAVSSTKRLPCWILAANCPSVWPGTFMSCTLPSPNRSYDQRFGPMGVPLYQNTSIGLSRHSSFGSRME